MSFNSQFKLIFGETFQTEGFRYCSKLNVFVKMLNEDLMAFIFWISSTGTHWTGRRSMMHCWQLPKNAEPNGILQKLWMFWMKWKAVLWCRNFGNLTAGSFPMRQIWSGASSWGRFAVYTLYVKRDRAYEKTRSLLQNLRRIQSQRKIFRQRPCGSYL